MNEAKTEEATGYFKGNFNCCQSIILTYGPDYGLSKDVAMRLGTGFAGGVARHGEICGAVSGAVIIIGCKYGMTGESDDMGRDSTYENVGMFINRFKVLNGSIRCGDLLNCDIGTPEGRQRAKDEGLFETLCPRLVKDASEVLEDIL